MDMEPCDSSVLIVLRRFDPDGNVAEAGDVVNGSFSNGHMVHGTWIKSSGEKVKLLIGQ